MGSPLSVDKQPQTVCSKICNGNLLLQLEACHVALSRQEDAGNKTRLKEMESKTHSPVHVHVQCHCVRVSLGGSPLGGSSLISSYSPYSLVWSSFGLNWPVVACTMNNVQCAMHNVQ